MTVATEVSYAERAWTGAETDFAPGMVAQDASHILVYYRDANGVVAALVPGTHVAVSKSGEPGFTGAVSASPQAMPLAPGTVIFERVTPAIQEVDFANLEDFDPDVHTRLHDAEALRAAELRGRQSRAITPWASVTDAVVDFRPRRISAAEPVNDQDVATKLWVLTVTGILNLTALVAQAAASAAAAAASAASALLSLGQSEDARDEAQLWAEQTEDTEVETGKFSALHWAAKSVAAAGTILPLLNTIDYGFVADAPTETRDYGSVL